MARVPTVDGAGTVTQRAAPDAYQRIQTSADDFGAAQGRALIAGSQQVAAASDLLARRTDQMKIEDNERDAKALDVQLQGEIRRITLGDEKVPGYLASKSQAALDGYGDVDKALEEARKKVAAGATNPNVQKLFGTTSDARLNAAYDRTAGHYAQQRLVANDEISQARIGQSLDDVGSFPRDADTIGRAVAVTRGEMRDMAERNGWTPEVAAQKQGEAVTAIHKAVIDALIVDDPSAAKDYFEKNKQNIDGRIQPAIEKALHGGVTAQKAADIASKIFNPDATRTDMQNAARKAAGNDAELAKAAIVELETRQLAHDRDEAESLKKRKDSAWQDIEGGKTLKDIAPDVKAGIDGTTLNAMERRSQQIASGEPLATNWHDFEDYSSMTADQLRSVDLGDARTKLADSEFGIVRNMVVQANQGKITDGDPANPNTIFSARADEIGLGKSDKKDERGRLRSMFLDEVSRAEEKNGNKKLATKDVREILNGLTDDFAMKRAFGYYNGTTKLYDVKVPDKDRAEIIDAYKAKNKPAPSEADIVKLYLKGRNK